MSQTTNVTLSAWVRWAGPNGNIQVIMHNGNTSSSGYGIYIDTSGILTCLPAGLVAYSTPYSFLQTKWTHVAITIDSGGSWLVYINGNLNYTGGQTPIALITGDVFRVSGSSVAANQEFNGDIDDVRVYNRALTAAEIQALAN